MCVCSEDWYMYMYVCYVIASCINNKNDLKLLQVNLRVSQCTW